MKLPMKPEDIARFWSRVAVGPPDACWPWLGGKRKRLYGGVKIQGKSYLAHRIAHYLHTGEWPPSVAHTCDNEPCCNPAHLRSATQAINMAEAASRERMAHKLSLADVAAIRASGDSGVAVARRFGVSTALISMIRNDRSRRHSAAT